MTWRWWCMSLAVSVFAIAANSYVAATGQSAIQPAFSAGIATFLFVLTVANIWARWRLHEYKRRLAQEEYIEAVLAEQAAAVAQQAVAQQLAAQVALLHPELAHLPPPPPEEPPGIEIEV